MCIGVPLQIVALEAGGDFGWCADAEQPTRGERLDLRLVAAAAVGDWVLAFQGTARRLLEPGEAQQIRAALLALDAALSGDHQAVDLLFADLVNREPQLPAHLLAPARAAAQSQEP